jgi:hypothetical protein
MEDKGYKFYLEAELTQVKETVALKQEVAAVVQLPDVKNRQPDLSYFSSIFVSTGTNLNNAHFLPSELVMAEGTVVGKAVDVEHIEDQIIGHIYSSVFTDKEGNALNIAELKNQELSSLESQDMHVEIASVIYKTRFPEIAEELSDNKWKVSMEAYYRDYDIMVGSTILTRNEAMSLGFDVANDADYGKKAKIVKAGEVVDEGKLSRVLRGICFSGVGIVKNPANPASIVLEATASKEAANVDDDGVIVLDYDSIEKSTTNNVTINNTGSKVTKKSKTAADLQYDDTVGVCVNYHRELLDSIVKTQDTKVLNTEWCSKFDTTCPVSGDTTNPECLIRTIIVDIRYMVESTLNDLSKDSKVSALTDELIKILKETKIK